SYMRLFLQHCLDQDLIPDLHLLHVLPLILIEIEAEHIAHIELEVIQILPELLFTFGVVAFASPDLEFDDVSLSEMLCCIYYSTFHGRWQESVRTGNKKITPIACYATGVIVSFRYARNYALMSVISNNWNHFPWLIAACVAIIKTK
nr:hypothetical protein [Oscillospiraceae bacterium]